MTGKTKVALALAGIAAGAYARQAFQRSREKPIAGEIVLITGGSRGLGLALARQFLRQGAKVAICARDPEELSRARADLAGRGGFVFAVQCDITSRTEVNEMLAKVKEHYGRIDILVNNAGEIQVGPIETASVEDFEKAVDTMFWGTVYPTLALLPDLQARGKGSIVNITSIGGKVAIPHLLPYTSAKFAAVGFSEGLRSELKNSGVRVTTIAPGLMRTGSYTAAKFKGDAEAESNWFSLGASLPGMSMDADRAARQIIRATARGDAEKILSIPAKLLATLHGLFPGSSQDLMGEIARFLLPDPGSERLGKPGWSLPALRTPAMRALLLLGRAAARRYHQRLA